MGVRRLDQIPGFNIDRVAAAAGSDPDLLRIENLDTDLAPPAVGSLVRSLVPKGTERGDPDEEPVAAPRSRPG